MSSPTTFFRRPTYRAPSPPTWACYEQIPYSESESECSDSDVDSEISSSSDECGDNDGAERYMDAEDKRVAATSDDEVPNMDMDAAGDTASTKDIKGKGRAVDPEPQEEEDEEPKRTPRHRRRHRRRERAYNPRPILTIHKSQGFVWNQVCFEELT
jgi:hypothetical protein